MQPITDIAARLGLTADLLEPYGRHTAKIRLEALDRFPKRRGKLVLITAITPTTSGEGKTVNTIGLTQGLVSIGKQAVAALREPSLGPVFGQKGGAAGGGQASLHPAEKINLHFNGDFHAITSAHNLLAALLDTHLHFGNELRHGSRGHPLAALHGHERSVAAAGSPAAWAAARTARPARPGSSSRRRPRSWRSWRWPRAVLTCGRGSAASSSA